MTKAKPGVTTKLLNPMIQFPGWLVRGIGRVVALHSVLESLISRMVYEIADVNQQLGRVVIRQPRSLDKFNMIRTAADLQEITLEFDVAMMQSELPAVERLRDSYAHGVFAYDPELSVILLLHTSGSKWLPKGSDQPVSKSVHPQGIEITPRELAKAEARISALISIFDNELVRIRLSRPISSRKPIRNVPQKRPQPMKDYSSLGHLPIPSGKTT